MCGWQCDHDGKNGGDGVGGVSDEDNTMVMPALPRSAQVNPESAPPLAPESSQYLASRHLEHGQGLLASSTATEAEAESIHPQSIAGCDVSCGMFCQQKVNVIILKRIFVHLSG